MNDLVTILSVIAGIASVIGAVAAIILAPKDRKGSAAFLGVLFLILVAGAIANRHQMAAYLSPQVTKTDQQKNDRPKPPRPNPTGSIAPSVDGGMGIQLPKSIPKPKPHIIEASVPIQIGDFSFVMKNCAHVQIPDPLGPNRLQCDGVIENKRDIKLEMTFTDGFVVDDKGNQYPLSHGPYYLGSPAIFMFGSANVSQELLPNIPMKFGFQMLRWSNDATAFNFIVKFTTSGEPSQSEVVFKDIPIRE